MNDFKGLKKVLIATGNPNKLKELKAIGSRYGIEVVGPKEVQEEKGLGPIPDPEETEDNYRGNALIKAQALATWSGYPTIGDDSGLEVKALDNRPGVYSARFAGSPCNDEANNQKLLEELHELESEKGPQDRTAHYHCSLALADPSGEHIFVDAKVEGRILDEYRGSGGFGYDPLVYILDIEATFAEIDLELKSKAGHRAKAAEALFQRITEQ